MLYPRRLRPAESIYVNGAVGVLAVYACLLVAMFPVIVVGYTVSATVGAILVAAIGVTIVIMLIRTAMHEYRKDAAYEEWEKLDSMGMVV